MAMVMGNVVVVEAVMGMRMKMRVRVRMMSDEEGRIQEDAKEEAK